MSKFKKLVLYLCAICFCDLVFADTETIQWLVDGQTYATTNCESGDNVVLPTVPERRGYTFQGWKDVVLRGTFDNWTAIPTDSSRYLVDEQNNSVPVADDYIILENATEYLVPKTNGLVFNVYGKSYGGALKTNYTGYEQSVPSGPYDTWHYYDIDSDYSFAITTTSRGGWTVHFLAVKGNYIIDGKFVQEGVDAIIGPEISYFTSEITCAEGLPGSWRLMYKGNWATDGVYGWIATENLD